LDVLNNLFPLWQEACCSIDGKSLKLFSFLIAALSGWKSTIAILRRYITFKITLLSQLYSLIFFVAVRLPMKKKFEVYFSTGNKGVD